MDYLGDGGSRGGEAAPPPSPVDPAAAEQRFYYPALDGLRFVAFLGVFLCHAVPAVVPALFVPAPPRNTLSGGVVSVIFSGAFGVDLFFVLSSFLITSLLVREIEIRGTLDVRAFWIRRVLRIWPLYFSFLIVAGLVEHVAQRPFLLYAAFLANWSNMYLKVSPIIGQLWSVSIEEQFYLVWPLILLVVPRRYLAGACAAMLVLAPGVRVLLLTQGWGGDRLWLNTFARLDPIAVGALVALLWRRRRIRLSETAAAAVMAGGALAILGGVAYGVHAVRHVMPLTPDAKLFYVLIYIDVAFGCGAVLVAALASRRSALAHPALVYLGKISYGLYVFHIAGLRAVEPLWWPLRPLAGLLLTILVASASYHFLERPFLALKDRFTHVRSGAPFARLQLWRVKSTRPLSPAA